MHKEYNGDMVFFLTLEDLGVDENLSYEKEQVDILDRQVNKLGKK